ncbi:Mg/Co/Ni transporter MgtE / CBS domain [Olavius algarvensis Delta 1 endosymbiont]|nr:Mg/Co/Ni transporter MgtE / CBS domain [Olavius algarvensis Delta 1 endosymbiont]
MSESQVEQNSQLMELDELIESNDKSTIAGALATTPPVDIARMIAGLSRPEQIRLLEMLGPEQSAHLISQISDLGTGDLIAQLPTPQAVSIVKEMSRDQQAQLLRTIDDDEAEAILDEIKPHKAEKLRKLMSYPENTAGALMITEYLSYEGRMLVKEVLDDLRARGEQYSDYDIQYAYVVSESGVLIGVLRLRDLLMAPRGKTIRQIMIKHPQHVNVNTWLRDLKDFFRQHAFLGVPVVSDDGHLLGVIQASAVREAANRQNNQLFLKFAGIVGGEESRSMSLFKRSSRRLSWLSINIVLNIVAASVIALYQDTLEQAIVLAVFLPIISDMSGCSGNQAVAVSIRELTLGLVRPRELLRVLAKESAIGLINGIVLGILLGGAAVLWKGNPWLGLVVGVSLAANTLVAVSFGGLVPLILRGMRTDPALASGPLLTTATDMCGFFFVLSFASLLLPRLAG